MHSRGGSAKRSRDSFFSELGISKNGIKVDVFIIVYGFLMLFMVDDVFFPLLMIFNDSCSWFHHGL